MNFIIKDSGNCSKTQDLFGNNNIDNLTFLSSKDMGIYDAINTSISYASKFYVVAGADDHINIENLSLFLNKFDPYADLIMGFVSSSGRQIRCKQGRIPLSSISGLISSHSVGTAIRTELHSSYGLYSIEYKILSDIEFLLPLLKSPNVKKQYIPITLGEFGSDGVSSKISHIRIHEAYTIFTKLNHYSYLQLLYYFLRLIKLFFTRSIH